MLVAFSGDCPSSYSAQRDKLAEALVLLASERLTQKQRNVLLHISSSSAGKPLNATQLVSHLSLQLNCSKSAIWNCVNSLKKSGLIKSGSAGNKGMPVVLTKSGIIVSRALSQMQISKLNQKIVEEQNDKQ